MSGRYERIVDWRALPGATRNTKMGRPRSVKRFYDLEPWPDSITPRWNVTEYSSSQGPITHIVTKRHDYICSCEQNKPCPHIEVVVESRPQGSTNT